MKTTEAVLMIGLGVAFLAGALLSLTSSYQAARDGESISATVTRETRCGSRHGTCSYKVEFGCGNSRCISRITSPFSLPFTGPELGEEIPAYKVGRDKIYPRNAFSMWLHDLAMVLAGVMLLYLGRRLLRSKPTVQ